jgi:GT2 family glycosyltransferase
MAEATLQPRVSLLMPNRDNAPVLESVLDRLATHTEYPDVELVVVDDGSTDGSREILRRWHGSGRFQEFQLVERDHADGGVVDALNAGLAVSTGELVVQLDADASIETPGWLGDMVRFFLSDARIGVVTARIVTDGGLLQACGINLTSPDGYHDRGSEISEPRGRRTSYQSVRRVREDQWPAANDIAEVDGGMGACMMYRRQKAVELGGYDRGFAPVWLDDVDLTVSMRRSGLKVFYFPHVRVVHHLGKRSRPDDQADAPGALRSTATGVRKGVGALLPNSARARLVRTLGWDRGPRWYRERLAQHFAYWRSKWGWDLLNPDLSAIEAHWGQTEICWRTNLEMRHAGEAIISDYASTTSR